MRLTTLRLTSTRTAAARLDNIRRTFPPSSAVGTLLTSKSWRGRAATPGELLSLIHVPAATGISAS